MTADQLLWIGLSVWLIGWPITVCAWRIMRAVERIEKRGRGLMEEE